MNVTVILAACIGSLAFLVGSAYVGSSIRRVAAALYQANKQRAAATAADVDHIRRDILDEAYVRTQQVTTGLADELREDIADLATAAGLPPKVIAGSDTWDTTSHPALIDPTIVVKGGAQHFSQHTGETEETTSTGPLIGRRSGMILPGSQPLAPLPFTLKGNNAHEWALDTEDRRALWNDMLGFMQHNGSAEDTWPWEPANAGGSNWYTLYREYMRTTHGLELLPSLLGQFPGLAQHHAYLAWEQQQR